MLNLILDGEGCLETKVKEINLESYVWSLMEPIETQECSKDCGY